jgi:alpha-amylase
VPESRLHSHFFDDNLNRAIFEKVARKCYYPATRLILELVERYRGTSNPFRVSFGFSGILLDQAERYDPGLLDLFRELSDSGLVEFTGETYFHSLAGLFNSGRAEFKEQAAYHADRLKSLFGERPAFFRNTECLYNDGIAESTRELGFEGILTEGVDWITTERGLSPNHVYASPEGLPLLLRNYRLSDDIGYRFCDRGWESWPLNAATFAQWLANSEDESIVLAMDYEAMGEHMWAESGIFEFFRQLPVEVSKHANLRFTTPTEIVRSLEPAGTISVDPYKTISWADAERDVSAWLGNAMQRACYDQLKELEPRVKATLSPELIDVWRRMITSDHLYYLATKSAADEDVHRYFSAYGSAAEGFVRVFSAVSDLAFVTDSMGG